MNGRELVIFLACLACAVSAMMAFAHRKKDSEARERRLDAMLAALNDPGLDAPTRAELLRAIARDHLGFGGRLWALVSNPVLWRVLWFSAGWLILVMAGTALTLEVIEITHFGGVEPAMFFALGFAMVTLPLAWREVSRRDTAAAAEASSR
jgi:hypothetical protein